MDNDTIIKIVKALADNDLLLIDTGDNLTECEVEVVQKKKNNKKEVVLFLIRERD